MLKETIKETFNYDLFKFHEWNRDIKEADLRKIDQKVKQEGWRKHPIIVDTDGYVYDGQHRLTYAKQHHLPVYYVVNNGLKNDDCLIMNTTRMMWTIDDYIKYYANQGNINYQRLQKLSERYKFLTAGTVVQVITLRGWGGVNQNQIKDGTLVLSEEVYKKAIKRLNFLEQLEPYVSECKGRANAVYTALAFCYELPEVDNAKLVTAVKQRIKTIVPPANLEWALRGIEDIYNWHNRVNHVYILTEYKKYVANTKSRIYRKGSR